MSHVLETCMQYDSGPQYCAKKRRKIVTLIYNLPKKNYVGRDRYMNIRSSTRSVFEYRTNFVDPELNFCCKCHKILERKYSSQILVFKK